MQRAGRIAGLVMALVLVVAACGDDDAATTTAAATDSGQSTTSSVATTSAPSDGGAPGENLDDLTERFEMTPLRTTYLIGEGADQVEIVLAQDPTAEPPIESIVLTETNAKVIITPDTTIICDGSSGMCFEAPGGTGDSLSAALLGPVSSTLLALGPGGIAGVDATAEPTTIAGRSGTCYTYMPPASADADTDLLRQCLDDELGFALLLQSSEVGNDAIETVMELTDFSAPTAEDFEPTGPVTPAP